MGFSKKLYELRKRAGLSQKELSEKLGVAQASINYWEKEQRTPSIDMIALISEYFGVSTDYLITEDYIEKREKEIDTLLSQSEAIKIVGKTFDDPYADNMLMAYSLLNKKGKKEAFNRVQELTEIPRYTKED